MMSGSSNILNTSYKQNKIPNMPAENDITPQEPHLLEAVLYISNLPFSMTEDEVKSVLKDVAPQTVDIKKVQVNSPTSGVVRFPTIHLAEMAFACYNSAPLEAYNSKLELHVRDPNGTMPEPTSDSYVLNVKNLPSNYSNIQLYQLFRPFGPLHSARIMYDSKSGQSKHHAHVQFYHSIHAQVAQKDLNNKDLTGSGRGLAITQYVRNKNQNNPRNPTLKLNSGNAHGFGGSGGGGAMSPAPPSPGVEGPYVDPCNLFIKNLDANISSSDLFNHFRKYGRIISARVMRDQQTGNSKGFGFVSYTTAEEADRAKSAMNGKTLGTKQIVVRLHEPKKLREAKLATQFNGDPTSPSETRSPSRRNSDIYPVNAVNEFDQEALSGLAPKARKEVLMSELQKRFKLNIPSVPTEEVNPIIEILVRNKVPEVLLMLKDPAVLQQKITEARSELLGEKRRRGSGDSHLGAVVNTPMSTRSMVSMGMSGMGSMGSMGSMGGMGSLSSLGSLGNIPSVMSAGASSHAPAVPQMSEREKFYQIIIRACPRHAEEVLDLIMTLSKKERSLCYFNTEYLNKKIAEAVAAVEFTHDDEAAATLSTTKPSTPGDITPVTTPPNKSPEPLMVNPKIDVVSYSINSHPDPRLFEETEKFLKSLDSKPELQKKQMLGDRLFPKVKALGLKSAHASKITITLLDTNNLRDLAHSMYDVAKLKLKVDAAAAVANVAINTR